MHTSSNTQQSNIVPFGGSPSFGSEPSALIFDHLHKCAGTTFRHQLASKFSTFYDASFLEAWARDHKALSQSSDKCLAIAGHTALGMHELLPKHFNAYYITVLREPFARALSEYRFLKAWFFPVPPLAEYLRQIRPNYLVNRIGNGSLELALTRLESFYHLFGLTERFDDFLSHLGMITDLDFSGYQSRNRNEAGTRKPSDSLRDEFSQRNAHDLQFYAAARDLFDARFQAVAMQTRPTQPATGVSPEEHITTSAEILSLISDGVYSEAAMRVDSLEPGNEAERLQLLMASAQLHLSAGKTYEALTRAHSATEIDSGQALTESSILRTIDPKQAQSALESALAHFQKISSDLPDSHLNRYRKSLREQVIENVREQTLEKERAAWQKDAAAFLHGRWVIARLAEIAKTADAKPVRVAIYGNGAHTKWLLALMSQLPLPVQVVMILDDQAAPCTRHAGIRICKPSPSLASHFDTILISSDSAESILQQRCRDIFHETLPVCSLYNGFPPGPYAKINPSLPRISIINATPDPNDRFIHTLIAQHYPNLEYLKTAEAASPHNSGDLLPWQREILTPSPRTYVSAIRAALEKATGELVCLINPGDITEPESLHSLIKHAANADVILGATRLMRNGISVDVITPRYGSHESLLEWWHHDVIPPSPNSMFFKRTALMESVSEIPEDLSRTQANYAILLNMAQHSRVFTVTNDIMASTESTIPAQTPQEGSAIARQFYGGLSPAALASHSQLDILMRNTFDDFIALQKKMTVAPSDIDLPPISVITPSFNSHAFLARACYSVTMQQYPHVEHIIVDGNSSDGTQELFTRFPVRAVSEPDKGMYDAVNKGIRMASHEFILVLSSDDFLEPGALHAIGTFLSKYPATQFLTGGLRVITPDRKVSYNTATSDRFSNLIRWWRKDAYPYNTAAYVFTRKHWEHIGGFDENLKAAADADFVLKSRRRTPFESIPDIFATWDMRTDCITMQTRTGLGLDEITAVTSRHIDALPPAEQKQFLAEQQRTISRMV